MNRALVLGTLVVVLGGIGLSSVGCGHKVRPYDAERLERKCGIDGRTELTPTELQCLARVAGLRSGEKCPLDVADGTFGDAGTSVWYVREGCGDVGIVVTRTGAIVGVEVGGATAPPAEQGETR